MSRLVQVLYPSNQLTLLRLIFIPFIILSIHYGQPATAFVLVLIAGISDAMDGLIARHLRQQTTIGTFLDPIADKLLLSACFVTLGVERQLPVWLVILVLSRDGIILATGLVMILTTPIRKFSPSIYGKVNTWALVLTILLTLLIAVYPVRELRWLQQLGIYSAAAFTVVSGLHYAFSTAERLRGVERDS